jgi:hypothetical protein
MLQLNINDQVILNSDSCPVIPKGNLVVVENVWNFPSTNKVFVTLRDALNFNKDRFGKDEPIISTILLEENTLVLNET